MITMQDIADQAGVSKGTVSYVLNGKQEKARINQETCTKVIAIAEKLGYRRNAIAQSMKTGKTNVIGVIGGLYSGYCMEIIKGINDVASKNNYMIKLLPIETEEEVENAARQCVEQRLAGVICRSLSEDGLNILRDEIESQKIPMVLVDSSFSHKWCSRIVSDDFVGAQMATDYLLKLGHRKIVHLTNSLSRGFSRIRYNGYVNMMNNAGIKVIEDDICITTDVNKMTDVERKKIKAFLEKRKPTAVFCASDPLAMELINIANELKIQLPEELSIIGFGDLEYASFATPKLTTIKQPFIEMGQRATEMLLAEITRKCKAQEVKMPVELIVRDSVKAT